MKKIGKIRLERLGDNSDKLGKKLVRVNIIERGRKIRIDKSLLGLLIERRLVVFVLWF